MPAPLKGTFFLADEIVSVETNDFEFLSLPNASLETSSQPPTFHWKLLRDVNVLDGIARTSILTTENLVIVSMGPALFAGLDVIAGFRGRSDKRARIPAHRCSPVPPTDKIRVGQMLDNRDFRSVRSR
jgi:hypothetical protein